MGVFLEYFGVNDEQAEALVRAGVINIREFVSRQRVMGMGQDPDEIGILLRGTALLEGINLDDQRRILDYYEAGDAFGERNIPNLNKGLCYVTSKSKCQVAFVNEKKLLAQDTVPDIDRKGLERRMAEAQRRALIHVDILGQRSLRQKLLAFLGYLGRKKGKREFELPFSLTDCADYLAVDRSAMMRELGRMKEEGVLLTRGRRIELKG